MSRLCIEHLGVPLEHEEVWETGDSMRHGRRDKTTVLASEGGAERRIISLGTRSLYEQNAIFFHHVGHTLYTRQLTLCVMARSWR
jgi:hypothetical protein